MKFGEVIEVLKTGRCAFARREGWNGKGMAIVYMPPQIIASEDITARTADLLALIEKGNPMEPLHINGYFAMYTAAGTWLPGWLASQADMLAEDWVLFVDSVTNPRPGA